MTEMARKAFLLLLLAHPGFGDQGSEWKLASKGDAGIQFRWERPAKNSCKVIFRDVQLKSKTTLSVTVQYLPHKAAKQSTERETGQIVLHGTGSAGKHVEGCEAVVAVTVSGVSRE